MLRFAQIAAFVLVALLATAVTRADDPGQDDLDKAMDANGKAQTVQDLSAVIRLCESAKKKGLGKENTAFAEELLGSTLLRRGDIVAKAVLDSTGPPPNWPQLRAFALDDLEKAVKIHPKESEAHLHIASLELLPGGNKQHGLQELDRAVETSAENSRLRARTLLLRSKYRDDVKLRRADLDEALREAPNEPDILMSRAELLANLDPPQYDAALADVKKIIARTPTYPKAYEAEGKILARQNKFDEALVAFDKAHEIDPKASGPLVEEARIQALQKHLQASLHTLEQAVTLDPNDLTALLLRAIVYQETGNKEKALADLDYLLKVRPGLAPAMWQRARVLAGEGKLEQAIQEMEKVRKATPGDAAAAEQLGVFYSAQQEYEKAIAAYGQVLATEPNNFLALHYRGDALLEIGKHAEAIADYQQAYKINPKEQGLLNNYAWVLATSPDAKLRDGKRALELATEACRLTEFKLPHILSTLAAAYAETGDFKTAMEWSQKSVLLADDAMKADLRKELASYQAGKPIRERHDGKKEPAKKNEAEKKEAKAEASPKPGAEKTGQTRKTETKKAETDRENAKRRKSENAKQDGK